MVACPRCGREALSPTKEWDWSVFHIKRFQCSSCDKGFNAYYKGGNLSYTVPKSKST